ncbi:diadenylate cyclase [Sphingomonas sp. RT2P30]
MKFLKREFKANGFLKNDAFKINDVVLRELVETIFEPSFEGRTPTHGAIICSHPFGAYHQNMPEGDWLPDIKGDGRVFCDGVKTFRVICPNAQGVISFKEIFVLDELDLFTIRDDVLYNRGEENHQEPLSKDLFLIKRCFSGEIIVLCQEGLAVHKNGRISFFKYQYYFKRELWKYTSNKWKRPPWDMQILNSILRIAIHTLGADSGVGGTIVLLHPNDNIRKKSNLNTESSIVFPAGQDVTLRAHQNLLVALMRNTDGAVLIDHKGYIRSAKNWLLVPKLMMMKAGSDRGSRHLTAQSFSTLVKGLVFVISSEGPVTVYCAGEMVFRTCERR